MKSEFLQRHIQQLMALYNNVRGGLPDCYEWNEILQMPPISSKQATL